MQIILQIALLNDTTIKWMKKLEPLVGIEPNASQLPVKWPNH